MTTTTRSDVARKLAKLNTMEGDCWSVTQSENGCYTLWLYDDGEHLPFVEAGHTLRSIAAAIDDLMLGGPVLFAPPAARKSVSVTVTIS